jgi:hypothetical protein
MSEFKDDPWVREVSACTAAKVASPPVWLGRNVFHLGFLSWIFIHDAHDARQGARKVGWVSNK